MLTGIPIGEMMKRLFVILIMCSIARLSWAVVAKYCMTYADFVADRWTPVDSLVQGRTLQLCQLRSRNGHYRIKTGDEVADRILKEQVFAVSYGKHLFVNCRRLRCPDNKIGTLDYACAFRYDGSQLCVASYFKSRMPFLIELTLDTFGYMVPLGASIAMGVSSWTLDLSTAGLGHCRCFLIDGKAEADGCYTATRMDDAFVEQLLVGDDLLLRRYMTVDSRRKRQSAANVLPVLIETGLIEE